MRQQIVLASQSPDPSLLIFAIPAEIALGGFEISAFVTPLDARRGGLLLALPAGLLAEDVLSPPGGFLDEALVGPSQEFEVDMFEEDERGAVASAGFKNTVLVADFSNSVLQFLREYDPVTDSLVDVIPFLDSNPSAMPSSQELLTKALAWATQEGVERIHFYSAREEQAPKTRQPALKKTPAKRITTSEQVSALAAQVALLQSLRSDPKPEPEVPPLPGTQPSAFADPVSHGGRSSPDATCIYGPPDSSQGHHSRQGTPVVGTASKDQNGFSRSSCSSTDCFGLPFDPRRRFVRLGGIGVHRGKFEFYSRNAQKRAAAAITGDTAIPLLHDAPAADLPSFAAFQRCAPDGGGTQHTGPFPYDIPGEVWWFQGAKRSRPCYVGHCACSRCSLSGRSSHDSRVLGLGSYGIGAKCVRCGKLGFGLHSHASSSLSGEDDFSDSLSQTFLPPDSSQHGHHRIGLSQGDRCPPKQTAGDPAKEGPAIKAGGRYIAKPGWVQGKEAVSL